MENADDGGPAFHDDPEDMEMEGDPEESYVLTHGTKAFSVSSNKALTSKFRGALLLQLSTHFRFLPHLRSKKMGAFGVGRHSSIRPRTVIA